MSSHYNMFNQMYPGSCEKYPEFIDMVRKAMENSQNSPCTSSSSNNGTHNSDTENSMSPIDNGGHVSTDINKIENHIFRPQAIIPGSTIQGYPLTDLSTNQNSNEMVFRSNIFNQNIVDEGNLKINNINEQNLYKEKEIEDTVKEENNENESSVNGKKHDHIDDAHSETGSHVSCTTIDESSKSNSLSPVMKNHSDNDNESAYSASPLPKEEFHESLLPPISDAPTGVIVHGAKFASYSDFESVFENWKNTNFHPFRVASSETLRQSDGSKNETFQYRYIVFHCAHYGKPRMRGVGKRPNQSYLPCGCKAMLRLNFSYNDHALRITSLNDKHNGHPVNQENYSKVSIKGRRSTGDSLSTNKNRKRRSTSIIKKESLSPTPQINTSNCNSNTSTPTSNLWKGMINGNQNNTKEGIISNPFVPIPNPTQILNGGLGNRNNFNGDFQNTLQNLAMFNLVNGQNQQNSTAAAAAAAQMFYGNPFQQQHQHQQQMMMNNVLINLFNQQRNQLQMANLSKLDKENAPLYSQMPSFLPGPPHSMAPSIPNQQNMLHSQQPISNNIVIPQNTTGDSTPKSLEAIKEDGLLSIPTPGQPPAKKDVNDHNIIKNILLSINDALTSSSKESLGSKITQLTALLRIWNDSTGEMLPMKRLIENSIKQSSDNNI